MKWNVGVKIATGFSLVLLIFLAVNLFSYGGLTQLVAASDDRRDAYEVLVGLEKIGSLVKDVELGQRSYALTGNDVFLAPYRAAVLQLAPALQDLRSRLSGQPEQQRELDSLEPSLKARLQWAADSIQTRRTQGMEAAIRQAQLNAGKDLSDEIREIMDRMIEREQMLLAERAHTTKKDASSAKATILFGTLGAIVMALLASLLLTRMIARPLQRLTAVAERITAGDLSVEVPTNSRNDEVGTLAHAFQRMTQSLRAMATVAEQIAAGDLRASVQPQSDKDVLGQAFSRMANDLRDQIGALREGANVLGAAANEIVAATSQLAASAAQTATAVTETTTTVEEVRQTAHLASQKAKLVSDSAQDAVQSAQSGHSSVEEVVEGMKKIHQQMDAIAATMARLSEQSHSIGQIIATVDEMATQSSLLAVNAAIEAAKAGEHGKGFGVVAQEVKSLAEQSRQATTQVRAMLVEIQKATSAAVMATDEGAKVVLAGTGQTQIAGNAIHSLGESVNEAAQAAMQIAASSHQQLVGVDQVAGAMENIKQASAQNLASANQLEAAARNLDDIGQQLKQVVRRYKVE